MHQANPCTGLELDPSNAQLKEGLEAAQKGPEPKGGGLFGPEFMAKLAMDPTTRGYLQQPDFMQMLRLMQQNPQMMSSFMSDPRFSKALSVRSWPELPAVTACLSAHAHAHTHSHCWLQVGLGINLMSGDQFRSEQDAGPTRPTRTAANGSSQHTSAPEVRANCYLQSQHSLQLHDPCSTSDAHMPIQPGLMPSCGHCLHRKTR